jgi:Sulfotransferase domain
MRLRRRLPDSVRPIARRTLRKVGAVTHRWRGLPSFVVVGGQRCGTTTIFQTLAAHPQVLRPVLDKGTDYYTLHFSGGLDWYRAQMPLRTTVRARTLRRGQAQVFEACTYYMFHPLAVERMAHDLPDAKLVVMLRDPVQRAFSAYKHEFARGFETEADFVTALELEPERLAGEVEKMKQDVDYESFSHRHHAYRSRGQFAEQLSRIYQYYPPAQVHVMLSESFFADPAGEWARLTSFLGLRPWSPITFGQHNARPSQRMSPDARRLLTNHFSEHNDALAELLGQRPAWPRA